MFQRKLIAVLVVALIALTTGVSQASLSRVEGMGLTAPVLSQFTDDYVNIYYYPTSVVRQNNLVLAELGNNPGGTVNGVSFDDQSLTLIKNFPRFGSIAYQMKQSALNSPFASNLTHEQFDVIWGMGLDAIDIAVRVDITNSSFESDDSAGPTHVEARGDGFLPGDPYPFGAAFFENAITSTGLEINTWGVSPGIAFHLANDNRVEGMVSFRRYSLDRNTTTAGVAGESWKDAGNMSYGIAARAVLHQGDRATWYPAFWYVNDDLSYEVRNIVGLGPRNADETYKNIGAGLAHNMRVNDNNLLIFGVAVSQSKATYERTDPNADAVGAVIVSTDTKTNEFKTTQAPLFFASLETDLTKWLKGRLGARKAMVSTREERTDFDVPTGATALKIKGSDFEFSLGTGIRFNNFDLDMTLNESFPLSGGWILSGDEATPFTRVSGTYHF
jgi:hypothetical protein